jgi:hypothetical protein
MIIIAPTQHYGFIDCDSHKLFLFGIPCIRTMKIIMLLLVLVICLSYAVSSSPVTVATGPFKVSFDINTTKKLINQPQYSDTRKGSKGAPVLFYGLEIADSSTPDDATKAQIGIYEYDTPILDSLEYNAGQAAKFSTSWAALSL